ncbi:2'-5' RNA ligase family protein [Phormidium tenue FACHB-886]|nr:2'-5' RNA ligase family protein [Phormidium tenue FACHB-886]
MPLTSSPLILTLKLDPVSFNALDSLRQQHFPAERNFLPAHITLFHKLPVEQLAGIRQALQELCSQTSGLHLLFPALRFLGRGVAVEVDCPELIRLRKQLAQKWWLWLSTQDQQGYRPHVTIQNKVSSDEARRLHNQLAKEWEPFSGSGAGLLLWRYEGGPWKLVEEFNFE